MFQVLLNWFHKKIKTILQLLGAISSVRLKELEDDSWTHVVCPSIWQHS